MRKVQSFLPDSQMLHDHIPGSPSFKFISHPSLSPTNLYSPKWNFFCPPNTWDLHNLYTPFLLPGIYPSFIQGKVLFILQDPTLISSPLKICSQPPESLLLQLQVLTTYWWCLHSSINYLALSLLVHMIICLPPPPATGSWAH